MYLTYLMSSICSRGTEERVVPFRESKLTRLFQNYFVGTGKGKSLRQGKITMFVNVSNNASVFDETIHVLKFSALTSKVRVHAGFNTEGGMGFPPSACMIIIPILPTIPTLSIKLILLGHVIL